SDIDLFTTTLPFPVLVFGTVLLPRTFVGCHPALRVMTLRAPESHHLASDKATADDGDDREARLDAVRLFLDLDFTGMSTAGLSVFWERLTGLTTDLRMRRQFGSRRGLPLGAVKTKRL